MISFFRSIRKVNSFVYFGLRMKIKTKLVERKNRAAQWGEGDIYLLFEYILKNI